MAPGHLDFVVTGCPRSGTRHAARVLAKLGYACDHEAYFNPWRKTLGVVRANGKILGESSWMAVPFLDRLPRETVVIHIVRDPLRTINSMVGTGQLDWPSDYRSFLAFHVWGHAHHWPQDVRGAAQEFWVDWNERIEGSGQVRLRIQLEHLHDSLQGIVDVLQPGRILSPAQIASAGEVPADENARPHLMFRAVTASDLTSRCREMARNYGYPY